MLRLMQDTERNRRIRETPPSTFAARLWSKADTADADSCWLVAGGHTGGYSSLNVGGGSVLAHVAAWAVHHDEWPDFDMVVDHTCHNTDPTCTTLPCAHRRCINPAHLELVTLAENTRRGRARFNGEHNRAKTHCAQGHPYDEENTRVRVRNGRPHRLCRACGRDIDARRREKEKQMKLVQDNPAYGMCCG